MTDVEKTNEPQIGRNEPCPCGSGKKYKRCHGVAAAPKITPPSSAPRAAGGMPAGMPPGMPNVDPKMMAQFAQAFQRLPKGQLQRLQSIMQKAMSGKDVTREAAELEASLPPDFQEMLKGFQALNMPGMLGTPGEAPTATAGGEEKSEMTEEEARALVAKAAAEGKISQDQAEKLLETPPGTEPKDKAKGISKFFGKLGGKKATDSNG